MYENYVSENNIHELYKHNINNIRNDTADKKIMNIQLNFIEIGTISTSSYYLNILLIFWLLHINYLLKFVAKCCCVSDWWSKKERNNTVSFYLIRFLVFL